jgi:LysR family glycine cleavage system transcriptional activator
MKIPSLNALRSFEAAARLKSFSLAGDELFVTYSAVSHQIRRLEEWLGRPVFERKARGVELTRVGEALSLYLSPTFTAMAEICAKLQVSSEQKSISVGCIPSIASRWLIPNLVYFSSDHPDVSLHVLYAQPQQRLSLGNFDVLITLGEDPSTDVENIKLFSRANKPACSPNYLKLKGPLNSPSEIAGADLLHDETQDAWGDWFRKAGLPSKNSLAGPIFQDFNLLATAVIAGHGIALCPTALLREELKRGDLVVLSEIETLEDSGYFLITNKQPTNQVTAFVDWFVATIHDLN